MYGGRRLDRVHCRARRAVELLRGGLRRDARASRRAYPATDAEERKRLQAEIDAAAFHAYGLDGEETRFVCDDFHRVQNPRLMTNDYFERVVEVYDELAEEGPKP